MPRAACVGAILTTAQTGIPFVGARSLPGLLAFRYAAMLGVPMTQVGRVEMRFRWGEVG